MPPRFWRAVGRRYRAPISEHEKTFFWIGTSGCLKTVFPHVSVGSLLKRLSGTEE